MLQISPYKYLTILITSDKMLYMETEHSMTNDERITERVTFWTTPSQKQVIEAYAKKHGGLGKMFRAMVDNADIFLPSVLRETNQNDSTAEPTVA